MPTTEMMSGFLASDYYEPVVSTRASSDIYIPKRSDTVLWNSAVSYSASQISPYSFSELRSLEKPSDKYSERESCIGRLIEADYCNEDNSQGRIQSRDRYPRSQIATTYIEGNDSISDKKNYDRPSHHHSDELYFNRPLEAGYHNEDKYQGRAKSRDKYSISNSGANYIESSGSLSERNCDRAGDNYLDSELYLRRSKGTFSRNEDNYQRSKFKVRCYRSKARTTYVEDDDRNENDLHINYEREHFEEQRKAIGKEYIDEEEPESHIPQLNRRTNSNTSTFAVGSLTAPTMTRNEGRSRRSYLRYPLSDTSSRSSSYSGSRLRSRSSSRSRSSKLHRASSNSSERSRSHSRSRFASDSNLRYEKDSRLDRSSNISNPSSSAHYFSSAASTRKSKANSSQLSKSVERHHLDLFEIKEKWPLALYIRNLPIRSSDTSLKDGLFHEYKKYGSLTTVKVIGQGSERYAVLSFRKPEDLERAFEVSEGKRFFGCKIEVTVHKALDAEDNESKPLEVKLDEFHPKATRTLYVGDLEGNTTVSKLLRHFDEFGTIIEMDIKTPSSDTSYAFIQYSDISSVLKAMDKLDGKILGNKRIKLGFGKSKPTNCVWLDGISHSVSRNMLGDECSKYGLVTEIAIDRKKGQALVFMESNESAVTVMYRMRGKMLCGKRLQVDFASKDLQKEFYDKLERSGQILTEARPVERRERRERDYEVDPYDDRGKRVRYEPQSRADLVFDHRLEADRDTSFSRGRDQNFSNREDYHMFKERTYR